MRLTSRYFTSSCLVAICIVLQGCAKEPRDEVISRHSGGEKQVVASYVGSGKNERLIERRTYDVDGELVLLEDLENGTQQTWVELNSRLESANGLRDALLGQWFAKNITMKGNREDLAIVREFAFDVESAIRTWSWKSSNDRVVNAQDSSASEFKVAYLSGGRVDLQQVPDGQFTPIDPVPSMTSHLIVTFLSRSELQFEHIILVDGRIEVALGTDDIFYRDPLAAEANAVIDHPHQSEEDAVESRRRWREALLGDEQIRTDYPAYYERRTGLDPTLSTTVLLNNLEAVGGSCIKIRGISPLESSDIRRQSERRNISAKQVKTSGQVFVGHSVQVLNIEDRERGQQVLGKLRTAGLVDAFMLDAADGDLTISLGIFAKLKNAERVQAQAVRGGVPAVITDRTREGTSWALFIRVPVGTELPDLGIQPSDPRVSRLPLDDCSTG